MEPQTIPLDKVEWKNVKYLKIHANGPAETHPYEYEIILPEPLASWDTFDYWEVERTHSMRDNLKKGDILFDIGSENGFQSAIYAKYMVGPENIVLFEPEPSYWPGLRAIWQYNNLPDPKGCFAGFASNKTSQGKRIRKGWPKESEGQELRKGLTYRYIHENRTDTPEITIDEYVRRTGIVPDAITADCEGAEYLILRGSEETLRQHKPLVWISEHPTLAIRDGYGDVSNIHELMDSLGYKSHFLVEDHERHILYWHPDKGEPAI